MDFLSHQNSAAGRVLQNAHVSPGGTDSSSYYSSANSDDSAFLAFYNRSDSMTDGPPSKRARQGSEWSDYEQESVNYSPYSSGSTSQYAPQSARMASSDPDVARYVAHFPDTMRLQNRTSIVTPTPDSTNIPYLGEYWDIVGPSPLPIALPSNSGYVSPYSAPSMQPYFELPPSTTEDSRVRQLYPVENSHGLPYSEGTGMYSGYIPPGSQAEDQGDAYQNNPDTFHSTDYAEIDSGYQWRFQNLPILDNLATQMLRVFTGRSIKEVVETVQEPEQGNGQAYRTLHSLFEQTKKMFARDDLFIDPYALRFNHPEQQDMVRKANLATFVSRLFNPTDIPFLQLDEHFLDIFVPVGQRLFKPEAALYLELKTQAYLAHLLQPGKHRMKIAAALFPSDLGEKLLRRRPDSAHLAPSEQDFINRASTRKQYLLAEPNTAEAAAALHQKYAWQDFLKEVCNSISRILESLESISDSSREVDEITKATLAAHAAIAGSASAQAQSHSMFNLYPEDSTQEPYALHAPTVRSSHTPSHAEDLAPTQVLYEKARQAAPNKPSAPHVRRCGTQSQRRPWSAEEEKALMDGLDRVKGPHWSQILSLYGAGGTISEILKDRNQVQLKDKARNLKLFFLKSGVEVPVYLQGVTGELKTRAPAQAAKKEATERNRQAMDRGRAGMGEVVMADVFQR